ncbi:hypothetical protein HWV03_14500 [Moritella sp. 36]|uniref:hypothetical protein n=1 Tax=Moritella sp. 36 TaxID=2746233 RepID=UPI001BA752B5|nr:hypothetical protein [Moritella sp. 36]QUM89930.1 hypothetical protein HWV03_14500 [Moritella sp. 36]
MRNELPTDYEKLRLMLEHNIPPNITTYQQYHALLVNTPKATAPKFLNVSIVRLVSVARKNYRKLIKKRPYVVKPNPQDRMIAIIIYK